VRSSADCSTNLEIAQVAWYVLAMNSTVKTILERVATWPERDQEELAEVAREIEARRTGIYELSAEEEIAIREGLADLDQGKWVSEESMRSFWKRCGVL
jgi:predicted transcriptional regulator